MQEKEMVNDILSMTKASMADYEKAISECCNEQLRSALQQLRNDADKFQYDLYKRAEQLGYYTPSPEATQQERQQLKSQLSQGNQQNNNQNMNLR
ncbi:spore coat protein [Sporosalibacterium faouarense]|uniref:spore coat protein n=1 Tax=Sporosalibacterium faouarense TaxID=516123 RepID=UPI00141D01AD|nr:spore coat protein [Sporosalibacterium faouarense]MTI49596.1 spore coat protein [Bacillota bacterium]